MIVGHQREAAGVTRGDLDLFVCGACGFVFNRAYDPLKLLYGAGYNNAQSHSPSFSRHLDSLVRHMVVGRGVRGARIVEVGCGDGEFLRRLVGFAGAGNTGHGFDPSYAGPDSVLGGRLRFERRYYDERCADVPADVVVSRHVIERVPDPVGLLRNIRQALAGASGARVFVETPCVRWILRNNVVWDFFYEHCSYFTADSLRTALGAAGFEVEGARHVFGGQYLWLEARASDGVPRAPRRPAGIPALCAEFARAQGEMLDRWRARVESLRAEGRVALWGAGAKGVTLANLLDPARERLECVVDMNPSKQGRFLPGTGHPIVSPRELPAYGVRSAILMNPNYRSEVLTQLLEVGPDVALI